MRTLIGLHIEQDRTVQDANATLDILKARKERTLRAGELWTLDDQYHLNLAERAALEALRQATLRYDKLSVEELGVLIEYWLLQAQHYDLDTLKKVGRYLKDHPKARHSGYVTGNVVPMRPRQSNGAA